MYCLHLKNFKILNKMKSSKLFFSKFKIAELRNLNKIKGGQDGDGQTIHVPKCKNESNDWIIED